MDDATAMWQAAIKLSDRANTQAERKSDRCLLIIPPALFAMGL
jgi:hypothetical protein